MALRLHHHQSEQAAIPLYTFGQLLNAFQAPAVKLLEERLRLQEKLLQHELAKEATRIAPNPEVPPFPLWVCEPADVGA